MATVTTTAVEAMILPGAAEDAEFRTGEHGRPELICPLCGDRVEGYDSDDCGVSLGTVVRAVLAHETARHTTAAGSSIAEHRPGRDVVWAVVQEGGSSRELYVCGYDTPDGAEEFRVSCREDGGYRTTEAVELPAGTDLEAVQTLFDAFVSAIL